MTDTERARALAAALLGPVGLTEAVLAALTQSFAAVRRDERRSIAHWLEEEAIGHPRKDVRLALGRAAEQIERPLLEEVP